MNCFFLRYGLAGIAGVVFLISACTTKSIPAYTIHDFSDERADGLSGLTSDENMDLWTIQERRQHLLRMQSTPEGFKTQSLPIIGIPQEIDLEAITYLGEQTFALGSESEATERNDDKVYIVEINNDEAQVTKIISIPYHHWNTQPESNHGIEALCYAEQQLIVGIEKVFEENGQRYAPLLLYSLQTAQAHPLRLKLTTTKGKISAMACRHLPQEERIEIFAIERHFGIGRILKFSIDKNLKISSVEIVYDFAPEIKDLPNIEGISFGRNGELYMISDNNFGRITGPTKVIKLTKY
jgi:uncharacterized protein YjiK